MLRDMNSLIDFKAVTYYVKVDGRQGNNVRSGWITVGWWMCVWCGQKTPAVVPVSQDTLAATACTSTVHCGLMPLHPPPSWQVTPLVQGGGGVSWGVYFAWEILCLILTVKFPTLVVGTTKFSLASLAPLCSLCILSGSGSQVLLRCCWQCPVL